MIEKQNLPFRIVKQGGMECWFDERCFSAFSPDCFHDSWWREHGQIIGLSRGRGVTWFVQEWGKPPLVLRHYWRGGLMGRLWSDRFMFFGVSRSRAMAEFALLSALREKGLPVPKPAAARCYRFGLFARADILIELIPNAQDLVGCLKERALSMEEWQKVGQVICQLHQAGVYHSDLNSHNLLLDGTGQVWVIDFDKCGLRSGERWKSEMLERLHRSLRKEAGLMAPFYWQEADWEYVMQGYNNGNV